MGYAYYVLPDGTEAGYDVKAICDHPDCQGKITRSYDELCGYDPRGYGDPKLAGCKNYYCPQHHDPDRHNCAQPPCGYWIDDANEEEHWCDLLADHEGSHFNIHGD